MTAWLWSLPRHATARRLDLAAASGATGVSVMLDDGTFAARRRWEPYTGYQIDVLRDAMARVRAAGLEAGVTLWAQPLGGLAAEWTSKQIECSTWCLDAEEPWTRSLDRPTEEDYAAYAGLPGLRVTTILYAPKRARELVSRTGGVWVPQCYGPKQTHTATSERIRTIEGPVALPLYRELPAMDHVHAERWYWALRHLRSHHRLDSPR